MAIKITSLDEATTLITTDLVQIIKSDDDDMSINGSNQKITALNLSNKLGSLLTDIPPVIVSVLNTKASIDSQSFTGNVVLPNTTIIGDINYTEISSLDNISGNIQTQLNTKANKAGETFTGTVKFSEANAQSTTVGSIHCNGQTGAILIDDSGHKRISWNDGAGGFNIRAGNYYSATDSEVVYVKSGVDSNNPGAATMTFNTDGTNGSISLNVAPAGVPGTAVTYTNSIVLNKDYAYATKNFGVGTTTPDAPVEVIASTTTNDADKNGIVVYNSGTASTNNAVLAVHTNGALSGDPLISWDVRGVRGWSAGIDNSDDDKFKLSSTNNDVANDTRITVQRDGKVGIGKTDPGAELDVNGNIIATTIVATTFQTNTTPGVTSKFVGNLEGNVTGNVSGSSGSCTGQATSAASVVPGIITALSLDGNQTGNAPVYGCRAWVQFDGTKDTTNVVSQANTNRLINGKGNVTSVKRDGLGLYTITFEKKMPNNFYAAIVGSDANVTHKIGGVVSQTDTSVTIAYSTINTNSTRIDPVYGQIVILG